MNQEQLRKKIKHSLNEGFSEEEVKQVLRQQNVPHSQINKAFRQIKNQGQQSNPGNHQRNPGNQQENQFGNSSRNQGLQGNNQQGNTQQQNDSFSQNSRKRTQNQNQGQGKVQGNQQSQQGFQQGQNQSQNNNSGFGNSTNTDSGNQASGSDGSIPDLDLTDSYYKIRQRLLLRRYSVYDQNNNKVLKAKKKLLSLKTDIPFSKPEGEEPIFRVISERLLNLSKNFEVKNEQNDETLAVLHRKRTLLNQVWRIRDPDDNSTVATIQNDNTMLQFLRTYGGMIPLVPNLFALIPHTYNVTDINDQKIGQLEGQLSIRDIYELNLQDSGQLDRESMIASIIAIDALEGN